MQPEIVKVEVELPGGVIRDAELLIWEEAPNDSGSVILALRTEEIELRSRAEDFFDAMCAIRQTLEKEGALLRCNGASRNVYPSGMSRSMGNGEKAYKLTIGQPARITDLVSIFESSPGMSPVYVDEQESFYKDWLRSLRQD